MKIKLYTISLLLALGLSAQAGIYIYAGGDATIPDNNTIGLTETSPTVSESGTSISDVVLNFTLAGGYGTDLSGYLRLGNASGSPVYNLTSLVQADSTISADGVNFSVDVSSVFSTDNPNDTWTLFFADTSPGGTTTLNNGWSLGITAVPEPASWGAIAGAGSLALCGWRVWRHRRPQNRTAIT